MIIEIIIFVFFIIIGAKAANFEIVFLISNLITFENKKSFIFMLDDLHFETFISIIKKGDKIFIVMMITKRNKIANVEMNLI